jgi:hypothetical protein
MTARQRSISSAKNRAEAPGSVATGSAESSSKRARTSGDLIASAMSALTLLMISRGGAAMPIQVTEENPGRVSAMVGTSGSDAMRRSVPTASSLSPPPLASGSDTPRLSNTMSQSPASNPCNAGAEPR